MQTKVSVITISKNDGERIERTLQSVVEQDYENIEYVVVDGDSKDTTANIVEKYKANISHFISEQDSGIYNAQNKGIQRSSGDYLIFINAGDHFYNNQVISEFMRKSTDADIVYGDLMIMDEKNIPIYGHSPDVIDLPFMVHSTLWHPVSFIKSSLFKQYGHYDESFKIVADYEFFLKVILKHGCKTLHIPQPVAQFYTDGIGSSSESEKTHELERKQAQLRYFTELEIELAKIVKSKEHEIASLKESLNQKVIEPTSLLEKKITKLKAFFQPNG